MSWWEKKPSLSKDGTESWEIWKQRLSEGRREENARLRDLIVRQNQRIKPLLSLERRRHQELVQILLPMIPFRKDTGETVVMPKQYVVPVSELNPALALSILTKNEPNSLRAMAGLIKQTRQEAGKGF